LLTLFPSLYTDLPIFTQSPPFMMLSRSVSFSTQNP
jgi:hypothetical protein